MTHFNPLRLIRSTPLMLGCMLFIGVAVASIVPSQAAYAQTQQQAETCRKDYNGEQLTQEKFENQYKKSTCPGSKGGNCTHKAVGNGSSTYYNIRCSSKAGNPPGDASDVSGSGSGSPSSCADIETSIVDCNTNGGNPIIGLLLQIINFLAVGVGLAVVGGIIWGGLVYASSNGDANKVKQAKTIIVNAIVGLLLFFFMYAFINYLVPGGLFN